MMESRHRVKDAWRRRANARLVVRRWICARAAINGLAIAVINTEHAHAVKDEE